MRPLGLLLGLLPLLASSFAEAASPSKAEVGQLEPAEPPADGAAKSRPPGRGMVAAGTFFVVFGTLNVAAGTIPWSFTTHGAAEPLGLFGIIPLTFGGGFVTLGALLVHFGQERRWAHEDRLAGLEPRHATDRPRPGSALLLAGPLTLAGGATMFTWGLLELRFTRGCSPDPPYYQNCFSPARAAGLLGGAGAAMLLGTTLTVLGARQRTRYLRWRSARSNSVVLRPSGWADPRSFGFGVAGWF